MAQMPAQRRYGSHHSMYNRMFEDRTPRAWKYDGYPLINDCETFIEAHLKADDKMKDYLEFPRSNYRRFDTRICPELRRASAMFLTSSNAYARIDFFKIVLEKIQAHAGFKAGPIYFVTFALSAHAVRIEDAERFDIRRVQALARQALQGIPFIGFVEAVIYRNWGPDGASLGDWVSWHCHVLVWGVSRMQIRIAVNPTRARHRSLLPSQSAVWINSVSYERLEQKVAYMSKAPQKFHTVYASGRERVDALTGEITLGFRQRKTSMRTRDRLVMADIMRNQRLDVLLFGNCAGTVLAREICDQALKPFRSWERRQWYFRDVPT